MDGYKCENGYKCAEGCGKVFQLHCNLLKHTPICRFTQLTKREHKEESDVMVVVPNATEMYKIMQHMACKIASLEKEVDKLKGQQNKKMKLLEWLHTRTPICTFNDWFTHHVFPQVQNSIEVVYKSSLKNGMLDLFERIFANVDITTLPIQAFDRKSNIFYIYDGTCWATIPNSLFDVKLSNVSNQFMIEFVETWYKPNLDKIKSDETYGDMYLNYYSNVLGKYNEEGNLYSKIRQRIYTLIKQNVQSITEIEI